MFAALIRSNTICWQHLIDKKYNILATLIKYSTACKQHLYDTIQRDSCVDKID
jgi:hypothetical protein